MNYFRSMTPKERLIFILLQIVTLGLIWIYWKKRLRQYHNPNTLSVKETISFAITDLCDAMGTIENINDVVATHTKVKLIYYDRTKIDQVAIKNLNGVSGLFLNDQGLTIIVGNQAQTIAKQIKCFIEQS